MNLFLPYTSPRDSMRALDDKRLNKQILELKTILNHAIAHTKGEDIKKGYYFHPVTQHYLDYPNFLNECGIQACKEYRYRFGKNHADYEFFYQNIGRFTDKDYPNYIYVEGSKNSPDCIRETYLLYVCTLFQNKLIKKWKEDSVKGRPPKWTKRRQPFDEFSIRW